MNEPEPKRQRGHSLDLAPSNPSAPPSHFRKPHAVRPINENYGASQIEWYSSSAFWGLAAVELVVAGGIGLWTRKWMGPDFLFVFGCVGALALLISWVIRMAWRDEWIVRVLALVLFEALGVARLLCSDHPGVKRYEYLIVMMIAGLFVFLVRVERDYSRRSWGSTSWWSCSSGFGGGWGGGSSGGGGGGCGG